MPGYARRSARVLLIDTADRLLLIRSLLDAGRPASGDAWFTPGGGTARQTDLERRHYLGHRWWTVAELIVATETVYPLRLAALVGDLIVGRVPARPVRLPWHH